MAMCLGNQQLGRFQASSCAERVQSSTSQQIIPPRKGHGIAQVGLSQTHAYLDTVPTEACKYSHSCTAPAWASERGREWTRGALKLGHGRIDLTKCCSTQKGSKYRYLSLVSGPHYHIVGTVDAAISPYLAPLPHQYRTIRRRILVHTLKQLASDEVVRF